MGAGDGFCAGLRLIVADPTERISLFPVLKVSNRS
jgi:hypothetical protein